MPSRTVIALTSAAGVAGIFGIGVLFGLGLLSSPRERQTVSLAGPAVSAAHRSETTGQAASGGDDRALSPVYPTHLNGPDTPKPAPVQQQASQDAQAQDTQAQDTQTADGRTALQQQDAGAASAPIHSAPMPGTTDAAPVNSVTGETADAAPVSLESRNVCDVDACARAYRSFRASDCTYQPYFGPRQLCAGAPAQQASRAHMLARFGHLGRRVDLNGVAREVERITGGWD
ncbi:MAG: multimodular transpeptidase-transglycosylase [Pseudolabrys sp.]|jgi:hypothetical protein|nr:multimodular transpeptidase-transglycosylase [Pseudolabrys sp.]